MPPFPVHTKQGILPISSGRQCTFAYFQGSHRVSVVLINYSKSNDRCKICRECGFMLLTYRRSNMTLNW